MRLKSAGSSGAYLRYITATGSTNGAPSLPETQFRLVTPPLAGNSGGVSIESTIKPGNFLRRFSGSQLRFEARVNSGAFGAEASFIQKEGLADGKGVSFEASDRAGSYIQLAADGRSLQLSEVKDDAQKGLATFYLE